MSRTAIAQLARAMFARCDFSAAASVRRDVGQCEARRCFCLPSGSDGSARPVCRTAQRLQTSLPTLRDMNGSLEDALEALGRVAAEIDEVATNWATVDEQSPGPALLRNWRAQIVYSLMVLHEHPQKHPEAPSRT